MRIDKITKENIQVLSEVWDGKTAENAFPIISISLAGAYDAYGRYESASSKNVKLVIRSIFDFLAIFFAALSVGIENSVLPYIAPLLLLICGFFLTYEIYNRVKLAILISPWLV